MKEIRVWPTGYAKLVRDIKKIPVPNKLIGTCDGYPLYQTRHGKYAIKERSSPES